MPFLGFGCVLIAWMGIIFNRPGIDNKMDAVMQSRAGRNELHLAHRFCYRKTRGLYVGKVCLSGGRDPPGAVS